VFTPDSQNVLYRAEGTTGSLYDLFVTAADGSVAARKLNTPFPPMVTGNSIQVNTGQAGIQVSSDNHYVVFHGAQTVEGARELYATALISLDNRISLPLLRR
jgi:hypothetical protein